MRRFFLSLILSFPLAAANLIQNSGFDDVTLRSTSLEFSSSVDAPWWTWEGPGTALLLRSDYTESGGAWLFPAHSGQNSLDLSGPFWSGPNVISQEIPTVVGQAYRLTFWLGNQDDNLAPYSEPSAVQVILDDTPGPLYTLAGSGTSRVMWREMTFNFVAASSLTRIGFQNRTSPNDQYTGLDDISVEPIPEPATVVLVSGAAILGSVLRRLPSRT